MIKHLDAITVSRDRRVAAWGVRIARDRTAMSSVPQVPAYPPAALARHRRRRRRAAAAVALTLARTAWRGVVGRAVGGGAPVCCAGGGLSVLRSPSRRGIPLAFTAYLRINLIVV